MVIEGYWYTNIGSRSENEDSCAYFSPGPDQYCAVICDGLGGHGGGKAASSIGVKALSQWQADEALPSGETILAWMNEANRNILATRANANQMKTTAVALYLYKNQAAWAHIGDSRLYHFHNGVLADYTEDHSLAQLSIKMGELHSRSEIPSFEGRSKLFRVIGDDEIKPQLHAPITLSPGDHAFLLCSDGLWERLLEDEERIQWFASKQIAAKDIFFIGRGLDYAISLEGSLKMKEISYIHSEAYAAGELKHGTISLITDGTPVIALATQRKTLGKMISNVKEVKARGAHVLLITLEGLEVDPECYDEIIRLPAVEDEYVPLLLVVTLQLIALGAANARGCDVDKPRNLAKSVTVE